MAARKEKSVTIQEIRTVDLQFYVVGLTGFLCNRPSQKTFQNLLLGSGDTNKAGRRQSAKHDPLQEYRQSPYLSKTDSDPTRILFPATAFRRAIADAALDIPGATKASVGRLTTVTDVYCPMWGVPLLSMMMVRNSNAGRTADVRTRALLPRWATTISVRYVSSVIRQSDLINLLGAAGVIVGVGDGRPQKGALSFGQFRICDRNDEEFLDIVATGGRAAQDEALRNPGFYDVETEDLFTWYLAEVANRELQPPPIEKAAKAEKVAAAAKPPRKGNGSKRQEGRA